MQRIDKLLDIKSDIVVTGITDDSRAVEKGFLFVATKGFNVDHYDYIEDAIKNGCSFIVCDRNIDFDIPFCVVDDVNFVYKCLCKKFYELDFNYYDFIGITGTDGKTTTTSIVSSLLNNCAYIGTNGFSCCGKHFSTNNTTPCINELYKCLQYAKSNNNKTIAMEVSSEALLHNRVSDFTFKIIGFTNITGDHFNVHGNFNNYVESKKKLLNHVNNDSFVVVNGDDSILHNFKCKNCVSFGFSEYNDYIISDVKSIDNYSYFSVKHNQKVYKIVSPFFGIHNVYNVTMAFVICLLYGCNSSKLISKIKELPPVAGRCEFLNFGQKYKIVLDYAHTINGVSTILDSFSNYKKIITVIGCAGGRDSSKRNKIGSIVMKKSDISIFTMDDPRFEDVDKIIDDMAGSFDNYIKIVDRSSAIKYALDIADDDSIVLILGKGRDNYMAIEDKKVDYCDYYVVENYFNKM